MDVCVTCLETYSTCPSIMELYLLGHVGHVVCIVVVFVLHLAGILEIPDIKTYSL